MSVQNQSAEHKESRSMHYGQGTHYIDLQLVPRLLSNMLWPVKFLLRRPSNKYMYARKLIRLLIASYK